MFNTPVLFLIFNRPETTQRVFDAIRLAQPKCFYIAADGPRANILGEKEKCEAARAIIRQVDWDCEIKTLFRNENLGCGKAVSSAISWFFENVEEGIILEDDCLPDESFFAYCSELLEKYRNDERIMHIGGASFLGGKETGEKNASYYFSRDPYVWGWATWRRAWKLYDVKLEMLGNFIESGMMKKCYPNTSESDYWTRIFNNTFDGKIDTWDYQWKFTILCNHGLCVVPKINMVLNIGFGVDATHTNSTDVTSNMVLGSLKTMIHPKFIAVDFLADSEVFKQFFYKNTFKQKLYKLREYVKK